MKKFAIIGIAVAAVGWIAWPYYAIHSIGRAVRDKDVVSLEQLVDWNSVRAGF